MKKTVNINVCGIIFHIDEDAYIKLNNYLERLKRHFQSIEGSHDIIEDIEARIAELLQKKLSSSKQVISIADVQEVIEIMGQPGQFEEEDDSYETEQDSEPGSGMKRFYRDPDNKVLGGVCSGISAYLHWDPVIIRVLFIISVFVGGFGILLYLILWIVIPQATTTSEKLEMRGEKVNVSNIEKSIQEELSGLKDQLNNLAQTTKDKFKKGGPAYSPLEQLVKGLVEVFRFIGRVLLVVTGVVLVMMGISFLILFLAVLFGWVGAINMDGNFPVMSMPSYLDLILGCSFNPFFLQATFLILIGIPVFMILYSGIRMIFRFEGIKHLGLTTFNIWLVGLIIAAFYSFKIYNLVKAGDTDSHTVQITQPVSDTINLNYSSWGTINNYELDTYEIFENYSVSRDENGIYYLVPVIKIEPADGGEVAVSNVTFSRGSTFTEAKARASQIHYGIKQSGDTLWFDRLATFPQEDCWRGQKVQVTIKVPKNKFIALGAGKWYIRSEYSQYIRTINSRSIFKLSDSGLEQCDASIN